MTRKRFSRNYSVSLRAFATLRGSETESIIIASLVYNKVKLNSKNIFLCQNISIFLKILNSRIKGQLVGFGSSRLSLKVCPV